MLTTPYYFRSQDYLYSLQSHPEYWFYTGRSENKQVLIGLIEQHLAVLQFAPTGEFVRGPEKIRPLSRLLLGPDKVDFEQLQEIVEGFVQEYRQTNELEDDTIKIKRFRLPEMNIGIEDLPDEIQEYILAGDRFHSTEYADLEDALQSWKEETLFVFWWGQSFNIDEEGFVTAS